MIAKDKRKQVAAEAAEILGGVFKSRPERFVEAYLAMSAAANYRPAAPGDGVGHTYLSLEEANDPEELAQEAVKYAQRLDEEEDTRNYNLGCTNFTTNRAFVFTIEAARSLCGGADDLAVTLLEMALAEVRQAIKVSKARKARRKGTTELFHTDNLDIAVVWPKE